MHACSNHNLPEVSYVVGLIGHLDPRPAEETERLVTMGMWALKGGKMKYNFGIGIYSWLMQVCIQG